MKVGNRVAEVRFEYFCLNYVSKIGVSVTECNRLERLGANSQGSDTKSEGQT